MKDIFPIKKVVVFSQWSRKSYAIFASLGKVIKIAHISADIADRALNKSAQSLSLNRAFCFKRHLTDLLEELRLAEGIPDVLTKQLALFMNTQLLMSPSNKGGKGNVHIQFKKQCPCILFYKSMDFFYL